MNFQALLFCQDEKTARVTTQLLNELEFSVETSSEPFAAVKKLMGQHFDAVVVDCENEQNASLLFKGARNSALNQSSLAVAVVEGQAGVANAFRIGANLVLTKPINIEQAKGTLRVARGLLKKGGETAKTAAPAPAASPAAPAPKPPIATASIPSATPAEPVSKPVFTPPPAMPKAASAVAHASAEPAGTGEGPEEILLDVLEEHPVSAKPQSKPEIKPAALVPPVPKPAKEVQSPLTSGAVSSSGAASAPAPARVKALPEFERIGDPITPPPVRIPAAAPVSAAPAEAPGLFSQRQSAPTFAGLDGAGNEESGGAGKFVIIGIVVIGLAAAGYFGYAKFSKQSATTQTQQTSTVAQTPAAMPSSQQMPSAPAVEQKPTPAVEQHIASAEVVASVPHKTETAKTATPEPEVVVTKIEPEPRVVKANPTAPASKSQTTETDDQAPSALAAAPGDSSEISKIVSSAAVSVPTPAPSSQMLKVSQGVTQGLLLKRVQPIYPHQAMQMRIAGAVQLLAVIDKAGNISSIKVLSGDPILARAAVDAVKGWKYKPYTLDGEPVDIQTQVTVNFKLP